MPSRGPTSPARDDAHGRRGPLRPGRRRLAGRDAGARPEDLSSSGRDPPGLRLSGHSAGRARRARPRPLFRDVWIRTTGAATPRTARAPRGAARPRRGVHACGRPCGDRRAGRRLRGLRGLPGWRPPATRPAFGNAGSIPRARCVAPGRDDPATTVVDGYDARRDRVPDAGSLNLASGMTLEALVKPTATDGCADRVIKQSAQQHLLRAVLRLPLFRSSPPWTARTASPAAFSLPT